MLISGESAIDPLDWERHTTYSGELDAETPLVRWFWEIVHDLSQDQLTEVCILVN